MVSGSLMLFQDLLLIPRSALCCRAESDASVLLKGRPGEEETSPASSG